MRREGVILNGNKLLQMIRKVALKDQGPDNQHNEDYKQQHEQSTIRPGDLPPLRPQLGRKNGWTDLFAGAQPEQHGRVPPINPGDQTDWEQDE